MHQPLTTTVALAVALTELAVALAGLAPPGASATASRVPVRIVYVSGHGGFNWGELGIGAAAGAGITMLGLGGALAVTQRRTHPTTRPRPEAVSDLARPRSRRR